MNTTPTCLSCLAPATVDSARTCCDCDDALCGAMLPDYLARLLADRADVALADVHAERVLSEVHVRFGPHREVWCVMRAETDGTWTVAGWPADPSRRGAFPTRAFRGTPDEALLVAAAWRPR